MTHAGTPSPRTAEETPEALAIRAQGGSVAAFGELVRRMEGRLYNFLLRRTGSASDAEELAQEAFVRAWERLATYDPRWRFSTWLFTIAARLAVSHHRARTRAKPHREAFARERGAFEGSRECGLEVREQFDRLWTVVESRLKDEQRTALWLRYAEGMSIGEIATVLKKTDVGVRVMLFRARQTLAAAMQESGGAAPAVAGRTETGAGAFALGGAR